jgi:hypothetical protein
MNAVDVPFGRPVTPFIRQRGNHSRAVKLDPSRQALHFRDPALRRSFHPTGKSCLVSLLKFLDQYFNFGWIDLRNLV